MSGLIADAKTLIDKARVEAQVSTLVCLVMVEIWNNFLIYLKEPLVYLWRENVRRVCHSGCVWSSFGLQWPRWCHLCHGKQSFKLISSVHIYCEFVYLIESSIWCCAVVCWCRWIWTTSVSYKYRCSSIPSLKLIRFLIYRGYIIFLFDFFRYHLDPSGTFIEYDAKAIGSGSEGAQQNLQDIYHKVWLMIQREEIFFVQC